MPISNKEEDLFIFFHIYLHSPSYLLTLIEMFTFLKCSLYLIFLKIFTKNIKLLLKIMIFFFINRLQYPHISISKFGFLFLISLNFVFEYLMSWILHFQMVLIWILVVLKIFKILNAMKTQFLSIPNQTSVTTNFHNLQNTETQPRSNKWNVGEDIILTSSRRIASQNRVRDKK